MEADRILAVDWSGAAKAGRSWSEGIQLAEAHGGHVVDVRPWSRLGVIEYLCDLAARGERVVVGFDFAFSFPGDFLDREGLSYESAWKVAGTWTLDDLKAKQEFWGWPGGKCPPNPSWEVLRACDHAARDHVRATPKSIYQVYGAGAVGAGSLAGMPLLPCLRQAGFRIWPFDAVDSGSEESIVVELWPRQFIKPLNGRIISKSSPEDRTTYVDAEFGAEPLFLRRLMAATQDTFDASVAALGLERLLRSDGAFRVPDRRGRREGWIFGVPAPA